jgi:isopenicillin N synthase-like dioxygenase
MNDFHQVTSLSGQWKTHPEKVVFSFAQSSELDQEIQAHRYDGSVTHVNIFRFKTRPQRLGAKGLAAFKRI